MNRTGSRVLCLFAVMYVLSALVMAGCSMPAAPPAARRPVDLGQREREAHQALAQYHDAAARAALARGDDARARAHREAWRSEVFGDAE